jgi:hypothetical protein
MGSQNPAPNWSDPEVLAALERAFEATVAEHAKRLRHSANFVSPFSARNVNHLSPAARSVIASVMRSKGRMIHGRT